MLELKEPLVCVLIPNSCLTKTDDNEEAGETREQVQET